MKTPHTPHRRLRACLIFSLAVIATSAYARYMQPELVDVPIGRLMENLETKLKAAPDDPELLHHLARAHAMAYAKRLPEAEAVKQNTRDTNAIWFGYQPRYVPFANDGQEPQAAPSAEAKAHLYQAIALYDKVLTLDGKNKTVVRLGRAWCEKEAGKTELAKNDLRQVIKEAWGDEGKGRGNPFGNYVSSEAMDYLKPLLDPQKDAEELADYEGRQKVLASFPRAMTPVAIPLDANLSAGDLIDVAASVQFDLDGTGRQQRWQWLNPKTAAWLVHDPRATGHIQSALQLFGNRSFNLMFSNGYAAMQLLDDNQDGILADNELNGLALWHDKNANGISDASEVQPLSAYGIAFLGCSVTVDTDGTLSCPNGVGFADGSVRPSYDLILESN